MSSEKFSSKSNEPENPGRRGFIRSVLGGAALAAVGTAGINKYIESEQKINELSDHFKGKEEDVAVAQEAARMLIAEMDAAKLTEVRLVSGQGAGFGTERLDILRDFLTQHLQSSVGRKYPFQKEVIKNGVYTKEILQTIGG